MKGRVSDKYKECRCCLQGSSNWNWTIGQLVVPFGSVWYALVSDCTRLEPIWQRKRRRERTRVEEREGGGREGE